MENTLDDLYKRYLGQSPDNTKVSSIGEKIDGIDRIQNAVEEEADLRKKDNKNKPVFPNKPPQKPEAFTLDGFFVWLSRADAEIRLTEPTGIVIECTSEDVPDWLKDVARHHEAALVKILQIRQLFRTIDERTCLMRYENPPKGTREAGLRYLAKQLAEFEQLCDLPEGYTDPSDCFADGALDTLRHEFEELTREGNPYPVPRDDPRERYPNGKLFV